MKAPLRSIQITILTNAFVIFYSASCFAQLTPVWNQVSYPSAGNSAYAIKTNTSGVYIAGFDISPGNRQFRLEKRDLVTGGLIAGFGTGGVITGNPTSNDDQVNGMAIDAGAIYLTGSQDICLGCNSKWRIEKRDLTTGTIIWSQVSDPSISPDGSNAITVDSSGVYVVGTMGISFFNWAWRVEKRDLLTGDTLWTRTLDVTFAGDSPLSITNDPSGIYIAGAIFDTTSGSGDQWRIEKRDLSTGAIIWVQAGNGERAQGITIDTSGIYVAGDNFFSAVDYNWRIEKRNLSTGALIPSFGTAGVVLSNPGAGIDNANGITLNNTSIYVSGMDENAGDPQWRIEERDLNTGALTCTTISNPSINPDNAYAITIDTGGIYIAGTDLITAGDEWRMEKYNFICNSTSSLEETNPDDEIIIYPNPFSHNTTVYSNQTLEGLTLTVYNSFGQVVQQVNNVSGNTVVLSGNDLPDGLYCVQLFQNNQLMATKKLMVAH